MLTRTPWIKRVLSPLEGDKKEESMAVIIRVIVVRLGATK
jgi:hypothetical protein